MLLTDVCAGFICCCNEGCWGGTFWALWVLLGVLCIWGVLTLRVLPFISTGLGLRRCAYRWTRPLGRAWRGHSLRDSRGVVWFAQNCACCCFQGHGSDPVGKVPYLLAFEGQPSLLGYYACMAFSAEEAFWRNCRQILRKTSVSRFGGFLCSRHSSFWWGGTPVWHLWIGRARRPGPNVGGWLTHGDSVLDTEVGFFWLLWSIG